MAVVRRIPCLVAAVVDHGEHVYTVELEPLATVPRFVPGQFLHLALDEYDPGGFWPESRAFSIASSPVERDSLVITYAVKGTFTSRMERELRRDMRVWVKLPYGEFVIDAERDAVLFAGGTGMTAFTAFIGALRPEQEHAVVVLYGVRNSSLFIYRDLVERRSREIPRLSYELLPEDTCGRLSADVVSPRLGEMTAPLFYLSGPPSMLTALTKQLRDLGVDRREVRIDAWE